ncbi:BTB/POZ fold [Artemisia annua]|uniref:BTB/POZ fold n=1 Tax=Artemisia annua TaxID=35608 RepID=A0A2U1LB55_ARTAN|nr:BTB/POZ fold [Artemisia annua]
MLQSQSIKEQEDLQHLMNQETRVFPAWKQAKPDFYKDQIADTLNIISNSPHTMNLKQEQMSQLPYSQATALNAESYEELSTSKTYKNLNKTVMKWVGASQDGGWNTAVRENQVLKLEIEKLGRVMGSSGGDGETGSGGGSTWGNMSMKFGFKLKSHMCSAQEGSVTKQSNPSCKANGSLVQCLLLHV